MTGAVDVDKISLTSVGGPPSDISNPETASLASGNAASTNLATGAGNLLNLGEPSSPAQVTAQAVSPIPSQATQPPSSSLVTSNSGKKMFHGIVSHCIQNMNNNEQCKVTQAEVQRHCEKHLANVLVNSHFKILFWSISITPHKRVEY